MIQLYDTGDKTINTALFLMASLSPEVKTNLENELYRSSAESDGSTDQYILESVFKDFVKDLNTIGLILSEDYSDLTEDLPTLFTFLHFTSYLLPNSLYDIIKNNENLRECVERILHGSLGNEESLIQIYLTELGGLDGNIPLVPELVSVIDQMYPVISQTEIFTDYMKNMFELVSSERLAIESHHDDHQLYRDTIRKLIGRLSDAVNHLSHHSFYDQLCKIQKTIIQDFVSPTNFINYAYLFTLSEKDLPEDLIESYKLKWYHYKVSHIWFPDYFKLRNIEPSDAQTAAMYCFAYAYYQTEIDYNTMVLYNYPVSLLQKDVADLYQEDM